MRNQRRNTIKKAENKKWEDLLAFHLQTNGLYPTHFAREVVFIEGRRFRLDFGDPVNKIGIEVQGGIWTKGKSGHLSGAGIEKDHEKLNLGILHGWKYFNSGPPQSAILQLLT